MIEHATNLLPPNKQKEYTERYLMRVAVVAVYTLGILLAIHSVLLVPTFLFFVEDIRQKESSLVYLEEYTKGDAVPDSEMRTLQIEHDATRLLTLTSSPKATYALALLTRAQVKGVTLTSFSFFQDGSGEKLQVRGVANDRATLESFRKALAQSSGVRGVELPVGAFA